MRWLVLAPTPLVQGGVTVQFYILTLAVGIRVFSSGRGPFSRRSVGNVNVILLVLDHLLSLGVRPVHLLPEPLRGVEALLQPLAHFRIASLPPPSAPWRVPVEVLRLDTVGGLVSLQVCLLSEGLVAERAGEGSDVFVHPHVHDEVVGLGEGFAADLPVLEHPVAGLAAGYDSAGDGFGRVGHLEGRVLCLVLRLGGGRVHVGEGAHLIVHVGVARLGGVEACVPVYGGDR